MNECRCESIKWIKARMNFMASLVCALFEWVVGMGIYWAGTRHIEGFMRNWLDGQDVGRTYVSSRSFLPFESA
jgi:hypothetical protein